MSPVLAGEVRALLDGRAAREPAATAIELITVDADGRPRVALLSAGEMLARSESALSLALWPSSRSAANLERDGRALLALVHDGVAHRVAIDARRGADIELEDGPRARFDASIAEAARDVVPYARLRSGITFELSDPEPVLARWRATIEALR